MILLFYPLTLLYTMFDFLFKALPASDSPSGTVNKTDLMKVLRLAVVASVGYLCSHLAADLAGLDFGAYKPIIDIVCVALTELGRRLVSQ